MQSDSTLPTIRKDQYEQLEREAKELGLPVDQHLQNIVQDFLENTGEISGRSAKTGPVFRTK